MIYVCLGYYDKGKFDSRTEGEQNAMFHLRANGH
jgi:hypothetical protein